MCLERQFEGDPCVSTVEMEGYNSGNDLLVVFITKILNPDGLQKFVSSAVTHGIAFIYCKLN
jgi:hypothetical protein